VFGRAAVNAGLWLQDPDVDALTRLACPVRSTGTAASFRDTLACAVGTWSPFGAQNTALLREAIPAYFLLPGAGRFEDVWASYVLRHVADARGDYVTYGAPLVRQERNEHDLFADLDAERFGLEHTDCFLDGLRACSVGGDGYADGYRSIADEFPAAIAEACGRHRKDPRGFEAICTGMRIWAGLFV
jgi:hypothetical protein